MLKDDFDVLHQASVMLEYNVCPKSCAKRTPHVSTSKVFFGRNEDGLEVGRSGLCNNPTPQAASAPKAEIVRFQ